MAPAAAAAAASDSSPALRAFFLPWYATGHIIPLVDIARLVASRGIRATVVLTPANTALIQRTVANSPGVDILTYPFPTAETGLPPGIENEATADITEAYKVNFAAAHARPAVESLVRAHRPDALFSDSHFSWASQVASDLGIPTIAFHAVGLFPATIIGDLFLKQPHLTASTDTEPFLVPDLPHPIYLVRAEVPVYIRKATEFTLDIIVPPEAPPKNLGVVSNSFSEMEAGYAEYHYKCSGEKTWFVGPVALATCGNEKDQVVRGGEDGNHSKCLKWLDSRPDGSVVYLCFGSWCHFSGEQLAEMASGLESSGHPFLWVVRDEGVELPEGLEERVKDRGLVLRGWAPQVAILSHKAVGGFVTHCGWNSLLEGLSAGLPMVTWPLVVEQFINEKLVTDVLKVGVKNWDGFRSTLLEEKVTVKGEDLARAIGRIMNDGEEAEGIRKRAKGYGEKAREAVKEGGSSYKGLSSLVEDIKAWHRSGQDRRANGKAE